MDALANILAEIRAGQKRDSKNLETISNAQETRRKKLQNVVCELRELCETHNISKKWAKLYILAVKARLRDKNSLSRKRSLLLILAYASLGRSVYASIRRFASLHYFADSLKYGECVRLCRSLVAVRDKRVRKGETAETYYRLFVAHKTEFQDVVETYTQEYKSAMEHVFSSLSENAVTTARNRTDDDNAFGRVFPQVTKTPIHTYESGKVSFELFPIRNKKREDSERVIPVAVVPDALLGLWETAKESYSFKELHSQLHYSQNKWHGNIGNFLSAVFRECRKHPDENLETLVTIQGILKDAEDRGLKCEV